MPFISWVLYIYFIIHFIVSVFFSLFSFQPKKKSYAYLIVNLVLFSIYKRHEKVDWFNEMDFDEGFFSTVFIWNGQLFFHLEVLEPKSKDNVQCNNILLEKLSSFNKMCVCVWIFVLFYFPLYLKSKKRRCDCKRNMCCT